MTDGKNTWSTPALARVAHALFQDAPSVTRAIQTLRPYICPFDQLVPLVPNGGSVLDFGCGSGLFLGLLAESGRISEGVGVDANAGAIATARGLCRSVVDNVSLQFEKKAIEDLSPKLFDVVCMIDVIHHVSPLRQERTIVELLDRLSPGGLFLYKDISTRPLWRASANRLHDLIMARQWIHYLPMSEVERIADEHGMILREKKYITRLWYGHDLLLFEKAES
jgi:2-polyprenyl-3-methyl-5-hydroxy-6-metoxy-1,4-benzoquinol methylase